MAKKPIISFFALIAGFLHIVTGANYRRPFSHFINGYLNEILLPKTMYLLTGFIETRSIQYPIFRSLLQDE